MAIDGGRSLPPLSVTGPGSLLICNMQCYIPQKPKRRRKQICRVLHTLSEMTMARSKIWMILDKTKTNP